MSSSLVPRPEVTAWPVVAGAGAGSLPEQMLVLRRRWLTLVLAAMLVPAVAWLGLSLVGPRYTATGMLLYDPVDAAPPGVLPPDLGARLQSAMVASQAAIITSLPAARLLAGRLGLAENPRFYSPARRRFWSGWFGPSGAADPDAVANKARAALSVTVPADADVLTVAFSDPDPNLAAAAANMAMRIYLDGQRDEAVGDVSGEAAWLAAHQAALAAQLGATEDALAKARSAAGMVSGQQISISTETASRLAASLVDARAQLAMAQARQTAAGGGAAASDAQIAPNVLPLRTEAAELAGRINALAGQYGADYPELAADRAQLAALNAALTAQTGRQLDDSKADVAADEAQVATLQAAVDAARAQAQAQDFETAPIRALEQQEATQKAMLQNIALQADELARQAALAKPNARVLSPAAAPVAPSSPKRGQIMVASVVLGVCLGLLLIQLAEHLDTSFWSGGAFRARTGLACLALVPEIKRPLTAPLTAPFSLFAEQMRALRTALTAMGGQVIAVTAARPDEGKTTLTIALARALAVGGLNVLAVDGDARQPSFEAAFHTAGAPGLTDLLANLSTLEEVLLKDSESALHVIAAGSQTRDALSLFLSPALPALLTALRSRYDVILLDVPPAFALAEARVLARLADCALLCVRWGATPGRVVEAAILLLREAGVNLAGAVLTRVHSRRHRASGFADAEMYQARYGGYFRR